MKRVLAAMAATDRGDFLTPDTRQHAEEDRPLPIGHCQTNSQPRTVAAMLALLDVPVGARVLDVGAGSGWTTALLAELVGPAGLVVGTEIIADLQQFGAQNVAATGRTWARIELAHPNRLGWQQEAPFDRILVSAAATTMPVSLVDQLVDGGVMVVPVDGRMGRVTRRGGGHEVHWHGSYIFVPLIEPEPEQPGPEPEPPATSHRRLGPGP